MTLVQRTAEEHPERLAAGIGAAWHTARRTHPLNAGRGGVLDLVDDLVEEVTRRGGQVALVEDGCQRDRGRVALVLPSRRR